MSIKYMSFSTNRIDLTKDLNLRNVQPEQIVSIFSEPEMLNNITVLYYVEE